jgi:hypothetical protein
MIFDTISIISDIAIIFLLAVQSFVLWKLKDPIISTAKNSETYKKLFSGLTEPKKNYPKYLEQAGIFNCDSFDDKNHIHIKDCY